MGKREVVADLLSLVGGGGECCKKQNYNWFQKIFDYILVAK